MYDLDRWKFLAKKLKKKYPRRKLFFWKLRSVFKKTIEYHFGDWGSFGRVRETFVK